MKTQLWNVKEKTNGDIFVFFDHEGYRYWGEVNPDTKKVSLSREKIAREKVNTENLKWKFEDLSEFLSKIGLAEILNTEKPLTYEQIENESLHKDLHFLVRKIYTCTQNEAEKVALNFNWEQYKHDEIIAVLNHFAHLGNHGTWRNDWTEQLDNPAMQTDKTNTELMIMLARAVCTVSKKIELGDTSSPWGDFTF